MCILLQFTFFFLVLANEKQDNLRKTGGGPPPKLTECEKLWLENSSKRASVVGLQLCLDTEGNACIINTDF